jgi:hypothetical protein
VAAESIVKNERTEATGTSWILNQNRKPEQDGREKVGGCNTGRARSETSPNRPSTQFSEFSLVDKL